jgi:flagellar hook-associated protein 2
VELFLSGLASGFDWKSLVNQLADVERAPQRRLRTEQAGLNNLSSALSSLATELTSLKGKADALKSSGLYNSRSVTSANNSVMTASAGTTTPNGTYEIEISQRATAAVQRGAVGAGQGVDSSADLTSAAAGFRMAVSAGSFTVNGKKIDVLSGDTLDGVLGKIADETGLNATYDSGADKVTLSDNGGGTIVLGSAVDSSNFLQAARLTNNGGGSITSNLEMGSVNLSSTLSSARLNTAVTSGTFKINGVSFTVDSGSDSVSSVLSAINGSSAGVEASYDSINDRFLLTNKVTGDIGISMEEESSNFLTSTKLLSGAGGSLANGQNAEFTVNGGSTLTSQTNTLTAASHGIEGLSIDALTEGSSSITIANNTTALKTAIGEFVEQYNKTQKLIEIQTASSTDADGVVTAGIVAGQSDVAELARTMRGKMISDVAGLSDTLKRLETLGYKSDGYNNQITLADSGALDKALTSSIGDVQTLFADQADGIGTRLGNYLATVIGDNGTLIKHRDMFANQALRIDDQVRDMEETLQSNRSQWMLKFQAMEKAMSQINRQAQFFSQRFGMG